MERDLLLGSARWWLRQTNFKIRNQSIEPIGQVHEGAKYRASQGFSASNTWPERERGAEPVGQERISDQRSRGLRELDADEILEKGHSRRRMSWNRGKAVLHSVGQAMLQGMFLNDKPQSYSFHAKLPEESIQLKVACGKSSPPQVSSFKTISVSRWPSTTELWGQQSVACRAFYLLSKSHRESLLSAENPVTVNV